MIVDKFVNMPPYINVAYQQLLLSLQ